MAPNATPKFCAARSLPYAWTEAVKSLLSKMEDEGIIEPVTQSEWVSPIVMVIKDDETEFLETVYSACKVDQYPLSRVADMFATLAGRKQFTKIDLSQEYLQLILAKKSRAYTTINTAKDLYQFTPKQFGVASASAIFLRTNEAVLQGMPLRHGPPS